MNFPILLISEIVGVIAVVLILSISPVVKNKRPLQFLYPKREGSAALTVGILVLLFTAFVQRFQPLLFAQLINFTSYPGLFNAPKLYICKYQCFDCCINILGCDHFSGGN